jgi:uncharacterized BrkB/YihY/UPF0761 family membrane protein
MKKYSRSIIRFSFAFIISFAIVGYVKNGFMVKIDWVADATLWSKLKWYYGYNFTYNLIPSLLLTLIIIFIYYLIARKKTIK